MDAEKDTPFIAERNQSSHNLFSQARTLDWTKGGAEDANS